MIDRLQFAAGSLQQFSRAQEISANNLANINTPGYKKDSLFYHQLEEHMSAHGEHPQIHQGLNMEAGSMEETGNPFDLAINGEGFFEVEHDSETFLTRNGQFTLDGDGYLRDKNGAFVNGVGGDAIHMPQFYEMAERHNEQPRVEIAPDGAIRLNDEVVDQIRLMQVDDHTQLERRTSSYLSLGPQQVAQRDMTSELNQGFFEQANVDPLNEMTDMMTNMRLFESQQRALRTTDEILGRVTTDLGRY